MFIEYILLVTGSDHKKNNLVRVLTNRISEVKKLYEKKLQSKVKLGTQQWNRALWNH
jgi:hypothetical protein